MDSSSGYCWAVVTYDGKGNVISGTCVHGVRFGENKDNCYKDPENKEPYERKP